MGDDVISYEPFGPVHGDEAFATYAELLEHEPVYRADSGYWVVTRHEDVRAIVGNPGLYSSRAMQQETGSLPTSFDDDIDPEMLASMLELASAFPVAEMGELLEARMIVSADPPQHTRLREIVNRAFSPRRISDLMESISQIVEKCTADIGTRSSFDVVDELAVPLPVQVIADLLSVEPERYTEIKRWTDEISSAAQGPRRGTPEAQREVVAMLTEFSQYFIPRIEARKQEPTGDLISALVRAEEHDTLSTVESLLFILVIMFAGNETTTNLIGNTVVSLMQNPDQLDLVCEDPDVLLPKAIEESLRIRSPFQFMFREPLEDVTVGGRTIPAGSVICVMYGAANRDPARFTEPGRFLVTRTEPHLAFGHGIHFCLGAHLARAETRTAVGALLPHLRDFTLDDSSLVRMEAPMVFGYRHVELRRR